MAGRVVGAKMEVDDRLTVVAAHVIPAADPMLVVWYRQAVPGLYVSGWLKRGPTGIIGMSDQVKTASAI